MRLFRRPAAPVPLDAAAVVDQLAAAYVAHPGAVANLLIGHAAAALSVDVLVIDPHAADHQIAMAAAEAAGTRTALLDYCTAAEARR